jgi:uncharacterized membrane protein
MSRGLRVGGHPLHAALSDFPLVLFLLWVALDAVALGGGAPLFWTLGHWALIGGLVAAGAAATAGFIDYLGVSKDAPQALRTATTHLAVMLSVTCIAVLVLVYRGFGAADRHGPGAARHRAGAGRAGAGRGGLAGRAPGLHFGVGVDAREGERKP